MQAGDGTVATRIADLLEKRGDLEGAIRILEKLAEGGDKSTRDRLTKAFAKQLNVDAIRQRIASGDQLAVKLLPEVLAKRRDVQSLEDLTKHTDRRRAASASAWLALLLATGGDLNALRKRAETGDYAAQRQLAKLLAKQGDMEGLRRREEAGDLDASNEIRNLLVERQDIRGLRERIAKGDEASVGPLADLLAAQDDYRAALAVVLEWEGRQVACADPEEIRSQLTPPPRKGISKPDRRVARLLARLGDKTALRERAAAGDPFAEAPLVDLLVESGEVESAIELLQARGQSGKLSQTASKRLPDLLAMQGDVEGLQELVAENLEGAAPRLLPLLIERGDRQAAWDLLCERTRMGEQWAATKLTIFLWSVDGIDELEEWLDAGNAQVYWAFAEVLVAYNEFESALNILWARPTARGNSTMSVSRDLAEILASQDNIDGLRAEVLRANYAATTRLVHMLSKQDPAAADKLERYGLNVDGSIPGEGYDDPSAST